MLDNDRDPDGDVILVTDLSSPQHAESLSTPTATGIQVITRPPGSAARSSSSTRSPMAAARTAAGDRHHHRLGGCHRRPNADDAVTEVDKVAVPAGSVSLNVLDNDKDPDGDAMILEAMKAEAGTLTSTLPVR